MQHACYQWGPRLRPAGVLGTAWHTRQPFASVEGREGAVMPAHQLPVFPGCGRFLLFRHWRQGEEVLRLTEDSRGVQGRCQWCGRSVSASWAPRVMGTSSPNGEKRACPLSDPIDCSLPGSPVHGIFHARVLEWGAIAFSHIYAQACLNN